MNRILRFWLLLAPLLVGFAATGYLFLTFLLSDAQIVGVDSDARLVLTLVALAGYTAFAGTTVIFGSESGLPVSGP